MDKTTLTPPENQQFTAREIAEKYGWKGKRAGPGGRYKTDCPLCRDKDPESLNQLVVWKDAGAGGPLKAGLKCPAGCHKTQALADRILRDFLSTAADSPPAKKREYGIPPYMLTRGALRPQIKEYAEEGGAVNQTALRWLNYALLGLGKAVWENGHRRSPLNDNEKIVDGGALNMLTLAEATLWRHRDKLLLVRTVEDNEHEINTYTLEPESGTWRLAHHELIALITSTIEWLTSLTTLCLFSFDGPAGLNARDLAIRIRFFARVMTRRSLAEIAGLIPVAAEGLKAHGMFPQALRFCELSDLDSTPGCIGAPNGVIQFGHPLAETEEGRKARLLPPAEGREKLITRMIRDPFVPGAKHPLVEKISSRWPEDMWIYFLEALGHALWGSPDRCLYVLEGDAGAGKTTLVNAIRAAFGGGYTSAPDISLLLPRGKHPASHDAGPLGIVGGRLLAFLPEPESRAPISAEAVKQVAGNETISFRVPYGRRIETRKITATIFMVTNPSRQPSFGLQEQAIQDRIRFIKHPARLPDNEVDEDLDRATETDAAFRQALVSEIIDGASHTPWRPESIPAEARQAKQAAVEDELGILGAWIQEEIEYTADPADTITSAEIWGRAKVELSEHYTESRDLIDGISRRRGMQFFSNLHGAGRASRFRRDGTLYRGWSGYRFKNPFNPPESDMGGSDDFFGS